ncbi:hypothetical protein ACFWCF_17555 [Rhodococcus sp. NPDC060090]|uniref:hypothetical protein n=1 Tax=Rhodococcus sp. NPDC060090 TaxID=3347056 RepID=UPI00364F77E0
MSNAEITAKLRNVARDVDDLLANISTGKDIAVVLAESREAKNVARAAGMAEDEISAAFQSGLS